MSEKGDVCAMRRNPFGWGYPAGAENDPNAPYNQPDLPDECPQCGEPNYDEDGDPLHDGIFCSKECEDVYMEPDPPDLREDWEDR